MIKANFNAYNSYVTDSVYQWDINHDLVISGLNLSVAPEIHFTNANMDRAIVRQSELNAGIVTVRIPNSLLQEAITAKAYVGVYEGDTFKVIETIEIPVIAKARPSDYAIEDSDEEIYSFNKLENEIANAKKEIADRCEANRVEMVATVEKATEDLENSVAETTGNLNARLDNLASLPEGSTTGDAELADIRVGYDNTVYGSAGAAVRGQVGAIESVFDIGDVIGNNILDPNNTEKGAFSETSTNLVIGQPLKPTTNNGRYRSIEPIVKPNGASHLYIRTNMDMEGDEAGIFIYFLDEQKNLIKWFNCSFGDILVAENKILKSVYIPSNCAYFHIVVGGASSGHDFSKVCISTDSIDDFEEYTVTKKRTLKASVLPQKIAPTHGKKMLVFGDSITETASMNDDGSGYNPNYRLNWPVYIQNMLQISELKNYAKSGATCRDTGYEYNDLGELVPKDDKVVYRKNLSEQIDLAVSCEDYAPDIIVISIGTNDSDAIINRPDESRDEYEDAMAIPTLEAFDYSARMTMHKALRYAMWKLRVAYPDAKCFVATPIQREALEIPKYTRDAIVAMGNRYGFKVIDAYSESGIVRETCEPRYLPDGLHPSGDNGISDEGLTKIASLYASVILSTYLHEEYL